MKIKNHFSGTHTLRYDWELRVGRLGASAKRFEGQGNSFLLQSVFVILKDFFVKFTSNSIFGAKIAKGVNFVAAKVLRKNRAIVNFAELCLS